MEDLRTIPRQVENARRSQPGSLVLYRLGDFYEAIDQDARTIAEALGLALVERDFRDGSGPRPMVGIPYFAIDRYAAELRAAGHGQVALLSGKR